MTMPSVNGFSGKFDLTNNKLERFKLVDYAYKYNVFITDVGFSIKEARCPDHRVKVGDIVNIGEDPLYNGKHIVVSIPSPNHYRFILYTGPPIYPDQA